MLKDPAGGDVEFIFLNKGKLREPARRLYAFTHVLEGRAFDYSRTLSSNFVLIIYKVLNAEFPTTMGSPATSDDEESGSSRPSSPVSPTRKTFYVDSDYELFHIVLFYLYTERVSFSTSAENIKKSEIPATMDAEGVYATARRLLLEHLSKKAFHFLQSTCDVKNITRRVFSAFAAAHEEVGRFYDEWFSEHWNEIKVTPEFDEFFEEMEGNCEEFIRVNNKFRKMIKAIV